MKLSKPLLQPVVKGKHTLSILEFIQGKRSEESLREQLNAKLYHAHAKKG